MSKTLKINDRVRVYAGFLDQEGVVGVIQAITADGKVLVPVTGFATMMCHPKQLRRIKLRKPRSVRVTLSKLKEAWDGYTKHAYTKHDKSDMFAHLAAYLKLTDL